MDRVNRMFALAMLAGAFISTRAILATVVSTGLADAVEALERTFKLP